MVNFAIVMLIPLWIVIYTLSFGRWLKRHKAGSAVSAYLLALVAFAASGAALWRILT